MHLISVEGYKNVGLHTLILKKTGEIWVSMKNVHNGLGVKNVSDLALKEIRGIFWNKKPYKRVNSKIQNDWKKNVKNYANLSEDELNTKSSKYVYVKNDVMSTVNKGCRGENKKKKR